MVIRDQVKAIGLAIDVVLLDGGAVVNRFLSGRGGLGQMYRDLGFQPDSRLDRNSIFDLVCGRPYCNLSREPLMYANGRPYEHPFAVLVHRQPGQAGGDRPVAALAAEAAAVRSGPERADRECRPLALRPGVA